MTCSLVFANFADNEGVEREGVAVGDHHGRQHYAILDRLTSWEDVHLLRIDHLIRQ